MFVTQHTNFGYIPQQYATREDIHASYLYLNLFAVYAKYLNGWFLARRRTCHTHIWRATPIIRSGTIVAIGRCKSFRGETGTPVNAVHRGSSSSLRASTAVWGWEDWFGEGEGRVFGETMDHRFVDLLLGLLTLCKLCVCVCVCDFTPQLGKHHRNH